MLIPTDYVVLVEPSYTDLEDAVRMFMESNMIVRYWKPTGSPTAVFNPDGDSPYWQQALTLYQLPES